MAQQMSPERLPRLEKQWKLVLEKTIFPVSNKCDNDSYDKIRETMADRFFDAIQMAEIEVASAWPKKKTTPRI